MSDWREFWNGEHSIYVNERHRALHDRLVARDIVAIVASPRRVLDYGCGEASEALTVARACGTAAAQRRRPLRPRPAERALAGEPSIEILAPEDVRVLPDDSVDLVVVNSLAPVSLARGARPLTRGVFHDKLGPGGVLSWGT